jgi:hypothetical protein
VKPSIISEATKTAKLLEKAEIDLAELPPIMNTEQLALILGMTTAALAQDRHIGASKIPYTKIGRKVRYLRSDVIDYLLAHRLITTAGSIDETA